MKSRKPFLALLTIGSMTLAGSLLAQDQSMQPPPPPPMPASPMPATPPSPPLPPAPVAPMPTTQTAPMPSAPTATMPSSSPTRPPPPGGTQANVASPQGQVTINSSVPPVAAGPAPSFEQLSGGSSYITEAQASAYPLLANDFLYVDKGKTGHINKAQYERWLNNNK
ncbi:MAG TPA: hypothetical protein VFG49_16205 [Dyella sp.]|uniref:hypothetical protein n=1 Tax=Dyella sp. TaxID=1869338 RepID=UPI002D7A0D78|nr:hypothetical protein [Dyella sp.]HET6555068.1 hypothetical protein [Dyella sp.]